MRHWLILALGVCLVLPGCSTLILRDDDTTGQTAAKVATRSILVLPTLFWSETCIRIAKDDEFRHAQMLAQIAYFFAQCKKEGCPLNTAELAGWNQ